MKKRELLTIYKNIAVVGVTENKEKYGYKIFERLLNLDYNVYGISPKYTSILDQKLYPTLEAVMNPIDIVVFVVSSKYGYDYINEMRNLGIKYAWMQPGSYDDELLNYMQTIGIEPIIDCILQATDKQ